MTLCENYFNNNKNEETKKSLNKRKLKGTQKVQKRKKKTLFALLNLLLVICLFSLRSLCPTTKEENKRKILVKDTRIDLLVLAVVVVFGRLIDDKQNSQNITICADLFHYSQIYKICNARIYIHYTQQNAIVSHDDIYSTANCFVYVPTTNNRYLLINGKLRHVKMFFP